MKKLKLPTKDFSLLLFVMSLGIIAGNLFALGSMSLYNIQEKAKNKEIPSYMVYESCPKFPAIKNSVCLQSNYVWKVKKR